MIRLERPPEPDDFDEKVRKPGEVWIERATGQRTGGPGRPRTRLYETIEAIPTSEFDALWTHCIPDLYEAQHGLCAYFAMHIPPATGTRTVDHFLPKSRYRELIYEWSNYRLASGLANSYKGDAEDVLDPYEIGEDWFWLDGMFAQVIPNPNLPDDLHAQVQATIDRLGLANNANLREQRARYADRYMDGRLPLRELEEMTPLVARELRRQGRLLPEDQPTQTTEEE